MSWLAITVVTAVMAASAALQGAVGFGLGMLAIPVLIYLDIRFVPGQSAAGIRAELQRVAEAALAGAGGLAGASVAVEIIQEALPCEVSPDAPIVRRLLRHAPDAKVIGSGGGTFAKDLVLMGVDAVGWAPGDEETYHQPNEEIEIEQLVVFAGRLAALAVEIASEKADAH